MPTTSNFGWTTPADTDLVKDGAAAIRTLGNGIDTSLVDLKGGTTGQVLSKNSNTDLDFTWVAQDDSNAIQNALLTTTGDTIYASSASTPARLGIGTSGQVLTVSAGGIPTWTTPSTSLTFTNRYGHTAKTAFTSVAYNGSNLYVAVGRDGMLVTSSNGTSWTSRTSGFGAQDILSVAFGNGLWVIVGTNGLISTSTDGITWTARTANMSTNSIRNVLYANSLWVAVGDGGGTTNTGGITYSSDGITWTRKNQSLTVGPQYQAVIWNGTNWIVGASHSTNNHLYASTPSGTWTAAATGSGFSVNQIVWDGSKYNTMESTNVYYTNGTTTLGTSTSYASGANTQPESGIGLMQLYNGNVYVTNRTYIMAYQMNNVAVPLVTVPAFLGPANSLSGSSPFFDSSKNVFLWLGADGYIILSNDGRIYTSF